MNYIPLLQGILIFIQGSETQPNMPSELEALLLLKLYRPVENCPCGTSLVAQWLRIHLSMQGTRVRALVRDDPTCPGATKPVRHNY